MADSVSAKYSKNAPSGAFFLWVKKHPATPLKGLRPGVRSGVQSPTLCLLLPRSAGRKGSNAQWRLECRAFHSVGHHASHHRRYAQR